ncbi:hypothetical protein EV192_1021067 [Actinocrispum wychmicini]|uniref:XRE family transcriptional regulator n=2 Tax=Actinocrispum wychmicini TaxID=1213861 RepID=A0A4R2JUP9_9PSEU|nr:hypothetical protein EV192_1021067 [Actinocrispum wychmicini]
MGRPGKPGDKAARDELRAVMLTRGSSVEEIAEEFRARWQFTSLAAYRYAADLTQMQAASRYNEVMGDDGARVDASLISKLEQWPAARGAKAPTAYNLAVLAVVYGTAPHRLISRTDIDKLPRRDQVVLRATQASPAVSDAPADEAMVVPRTGAVVARPARRSLLSETDERRCQTRPAERVAALLGFTGEHNLDRLVLAVADESRDFAVWTESSELGRTTMDIYRSQLSELSGLFLHQPAAVLFPRLVRLRSTLLAHLYEHQPLRRSRALYALTGMACVVLAHASHVLGHRSSGVTHAQLAQLCAQEADHVELHAWALGTQALLAEAANRPKDALRHLRAAGEELARSRVPGTAAVRLASYEARLAARVGQHEQARAALAAAEHTREQVGGNGEIAELDDIGGILSFPDAKQEFFSAEANLLLGQHESAEQNALAAIASYTDGPPEQSSYGDVALARLDVAAARLATNDLDGMRDALQPVLTLPADLRIEPLRGPMSTLASTLAHHRYRGSHLADNVRAAIESYDLVPREISGS